jgi:hypothetical protein
MHQVIIYGHDPMLLRTRELLLERAGFEVRTSDQLHEAQEMLAARPVDLLILCHTVNAMERSAILDSAHAAQKNLAVLFLSADWQSPDVAKNDAVFRTLDGPYGFLRTVCELTHEPVPPPSFISQSPNSGKRICHDSQAR